jgi:hypothetical protein
MENEVMWMEGFFWRFIFFIEILIFQFFINLCPEFLGGKYLAWIELCSCSSDPIFILEHFENFHNLEVVQQF